MSDKNNFPFPLTGGFSFREEIPLFEKAGSGGNFELFKAV